MQQYHCATVYKKIYFKAACIFQSVRNQFAVWFQLWKLIEAA